MRSQFLKGDHTSIIVLIATTMLSILIPLGAAFTNHRTLHRIPHTYPIYSFPTEAKCWQIAVSPQTSLHTHLNAIPHLLHLSSFNPPRLVCLEAKPLNRGLSRSLTSLRAHSDYKRDATSINSLNLLNFVFTTLSHTLAHTHPHTHIRNHTLVDICLQSDNCLTFPGSSKGSR